MIALPMQQCNHPMTADNGPADLGRRALLNRRYALCCSCSCYGHGMLIITARYVARVIALAVLVAGLTGCFESRTELISADAADYPFQTMTYVPDGEDDKVTLERAGDRYLAAGEDDKVSVRFKALGNNLFVVQISDVKDDGPLHLYGFIKLAPDKASFDLIKGIAEADDLKAAAAGKAGFATCPDDDGSVCIGTLEGFIGYAMKAGAGSAKRFNILAME